MSTERDLTTEQYQAEVRSLRADLQAIRAGAEPDGAKPKRLSLSEILGAHLTAMTNRGGGEHSTVRLVRNARGDVQIEVSVRTGESDEVATVEQASAKAAEVYDALAMVYPPPRPVAKEGP